VPIVLKSGSLNLLEPSGPDKACNGIALPFSVTNSVAMCVLAKPTTKYSILNVTGSSPRCYSASSHTFVFMHTKTPSSKCPLFRNVFSFSGVFSLLSILSMILVEDLYFINSSSLGISW
jgi:hypothetical protein